jgi:hypothetical protein
MLSMSTFGVGGESLTVVQKSMLASWFRDSTEFPQLAFATGLPLTFGYIGVIVNRWTVPHIAASSVPDAFLLNCAVCVGSFAGMVGATSLHRRAVVGDNSTAKPTVGELGEHVPHDVQRRSGCGCTSASRQFYVQLGNLPSAFYLLSVMLGLSSPLFGAFETFGPTVFVESWHYQVEAAEKLSSLVQLFGLVLMPLIGVAYDAKGKRLAGGSVGCGMFALSWLALTRGAELGLGDPITPIATTVGIAAGASLMFGGLWPCVPLLVDKEHVGTAFGFMTAAQNCCLSFVLIGVGTSRDVTGGFATMGLALACLGGASALLGVVVNLSWKEQERVSAQDQTHMNGGRECQNGYNCVPSGLSHPQLSMDVSA